MSGLPMIFVAAVVCRSYSEDGDARKAARDGFHACVIAMVLTGLVDWLDPFSWLEGRLLLP